MSEQVRDFLASFDALPNPDKQAAVVEILRRTQPEGDVPASVLDGLADDLFSSLDSEEAARAQR